VALGDKTGLLALKQHFKHVSIAMTDRYVGRDLELLDLVETEKQHQLRHALDDLIGAECLAGKLGEQIVARNRRFRGRAGEEVRRDYVRMVLEETDPVILPPEYGYCLPSRTRSLQWRVGACGALYVHHMHELRRRTRARAVLHLKSTRPGCPCRKPRVMSHSWPPKRKRFRKGWHEEDASVGVAGSGRAGAGPRRAWRWRQFARSVLPTWSMGVLIARARCGPTGLMLARDSALAGVDVAIVELRAMQDLLGLRAGGLRARTIEVLDRRGVAVGFLRSGRRRVPGWDSTI
jgi:FAD binding domain